MIVKHLEHFMNRNKFIIFFLNIDEDKWKTEAKTEEGAVQEYTISYQNLVPESTYLFRVIAYNKYSISYPAESQDEVNIKKVL